MFKIRFQSCNRFFLRWNKSRGNMDLSHFDFYVLSFGLFFCQIDFILKLKDHSYFFQGFNAIKYCFSVWRKTLFYYDSYEYKNTWVLWYCLRISTY